MDPDKATKKNDMGFNKADVALGHALARLYQSGLMTSKEAFLGAYIGHKYHGQIGQDEADVLREIVGLKPMERKNVKAKPTTKAPKGVPYPTREDLKALDEEPADAVARHLTECLANDDQDKAKAIWAIVWGNHDVRDLLTEEQLDTLAGIAAQGRQSPDSKEDAKRIRTALKKISGKPWSVRLGKGTDYCWIQIDSPPKRQFPMEGESYDRMTEADAHELAEMVGDDVTHPMALLNFRVNSYSVSPDARSSLLDRLEALANAPAKKTTKNEPKPEPKPDPELLSERITGYQAVEFFGDGDKALGGYADDRVLAKEGHFLKHNQYSPEDIAVFKTEKAAQDAGNRAPKRPGSKVGVVPIYGPLPEVEPMAKTEPKPTPTEPAKSKPESQPTKKTLREGETFITDDPRVVMDVHVKGMSKNSAIRTSDIRPGDMVQRNYGYVGYIIAVSQPTVKSVDLFEVGADCRMALQRALLKSDRSLLFDNGEVRKVRQRAATLQPMVPWQNKTWKEKIEKLVGTWRVSSYWNEEDNTWEHTSTSQNVEEPTLTEPAKSAAEKAIEKRMYDLAVSEVLDELMGDGEPEPEPKPEPKKKSGSCDECGHWDQRLTLCYDSSGLEGYCCYRCASQSPYERSFA